MPRFDADFDGWRELLSGRALNQVPVSLMEAGAKLSVATGAVQFKPESHLAIRVFNRPDARDEEGIVNSEHLPFDLQRAWVRYTLKTKHDGQVAIAGLEAKAGTAIELHDYRAHAATDDAWSSLRDDLASPRSLLEIADVRKLAPGEALSLDVGGTLTSAIDFSLADAVSDHLRELVRDLPRFAGSIALRFSSGLQIEASVRVRDQFTLVISRMPDTRFRVAFMKRKSRDRSVGIEVSVGATVDAVSAVDALIAPLFEAITGVALDVAEELARNLGFGAVRDEERQLLDRLARHFDVATEKDRETLVRDAIRDLRSDLRRRVTEFARLKAAATFTAEYEAIDENTAIADYLVADLDELERDHPHLLAGDFARITMTLRDAPGTRSLLKFLNESEQTRRRTSGFSFHIGRAKVEAKDESVFRSTRRTSLDGHQLVTCRGTASYREQLIPQNDFEWMIELRATTGEYRLSPVTNDFRFSLRYTATLERESLTESDLERMLDFAAMWQIASGDAAAFRTLLGQSATVRVQFRLGGDDLLRALSAPSGDWPAALAVAMPYANVFPERRTHAQRAAIYREPFAQWLANPESDPRGFLPRIDSGLVLLEESNLPGSFGWTVTTGHPQLRRRLDSFERGIAMLHDAITTPRPPEVISVAWDLLRQFWGQRLYVAASGTWLLERALADGADVNRSIRIEAGGTTIAA